MNTWQISEKMKAPFLKAKTLRINSKNKDYFDIEKISYGDESQQVMLYITPKKKDALEKNAVFFIHGGCWKTGNPKFYRFIGYFFARLGYRTLVVGYRQTPKYIFPSQREDIFTAFDKGLERLRDDGFNGKIIVAGQSSGAQLGGLLIYNTEARKMYHLDKDLFAGFVSISGAVCFQECSGKYIKRLIKRYISSDENAAEADVVNFATGEENIPVLLIHGEKDPVIQFTNSSAMACRINRKRIDLAKVLYAKGKHHFDLLSMFWKDNEECRQLKKWLAAR